MRHKLDKTLKARSCELRTNQTPAERKLWAILRAHRFQGVKFARQVVVGPYIIDFAARSRRIAFEIDGHTHGAQVEYDAVRTDYLEEQGYRVIRFTNGEVTHNGAGVAEAIAGALASAPLQQRGAGCPRHPAGHAGGMTDRVAPLPAGERGR